VRQGLVSKSAMPDADNRATVERFVKAFSAMDLDSYESTLADDAVHVYPQSGERFRGRSNLRAMLEGAPQRDQGFHPSLDHVIGGEPSWVLSPGFTALRVDGSGEQFTATGRVHYANGEEWHLVQLFEVRGGQITQITSYFAEPFDAPDARAPFREPVGR
jgi:ketosteroid isomerase-like protein